MNLILIVLSAFGIVGIVVGVIAICDFLFSVLPKRIYFLEQDIEKLQHRIFSVEQNVIKKKRSK